MGSRVQIRSSVEIVASGPRFAFGELFFIDSLNVFDTIYGTTGGGPGDASRVLNMMALEEGFLWYNLSIGITVTVFLWAVCMAVGYTLFRYVQRERQGGLA